MLAIGHFALGYLTGKTSSKFLAIKLSLPLIFAASVLPDLDLILPLHHRGPTHSLFTIIAITIPFLIIFRKKAVPYAIASLSHVLIGDFFTGGSALFWPLSSEWVGIVTVTVSDLSSVLAELVLFAFATIIQLRTKDLQTLLRPRNINLVLLIPLGAVLGPLLRLEQEFMYLLPQLLAIPILLFIPSLFYLLLFGYSMLIELKEKIRQLNPSRLVLNLCKQF